MNSSLVTNIQGFSIHDGPGIRTVVFFKGCSLECRWCANPECISPRPETGFVKSLCTKCGKCAEACPQAAITHKAGKLPEIDRNACTGCGTCCSVCSYSALVLYGKPMTADEIFDIVSRDRMFYESSGGGVTVSGGEALLQPQMVQEIFKKCRNAGIHTCIETSGCAPEANLKLVLPFTDNLLYDLKLMDKTKHKQFTGQPNDLLISNARMAAESGVEMIFRIPLIPGVNDDQKNIDETAEFLRKMRAASRRIEIMPYHRLGKGKYDSLGKNYTMDGLVPPAQEQIDMVKKAFENKGITCTVSR